MTGLYNPLLTFFFSSLYPPHTVLHLCNSLEIHSQNLFDISEHQAPLAFGQDKKGNIMPNIRNMSNREHEQEHRQNNGNGSTNIGNSSSARVNAEHGLQQGSGHNGVHQAAVDSGRDSHGDRPRRGAIDFGRGPHEGLFSSRNGANEDSEGSNSMRRGSAADHDEFRGTVAGRGSERRPVNSRHQMDLEHDRSVRGQSYRPASEEETRRSQQSRSRVERPRHTEGVSHEARNDGEADFEPRGLRRAVPLTEARVEKGEDDFEPRGLRRAVPLTQQRVDERAEYVYYRPHGPRRDAKPNSARH